MFPGSKIAAPAVYSEGGGGTGFEQLSAGEQYTDTDTLGPPSGGGKGGRNESAPDKEIQGGTAEVRIS